MSEHEDTDDKGKKHLVRIHIDREPFQSSDPTTGEALYLLGGVAKHRELFREVAGNHEDELIARDAAKIHVREDEHFYSQKAIHIVVNGEKKETAETRLSYEEVVKLADGLPSGPNILYTVLYRHGPHANPEGTLTAGHSVKIKNGMTFDVSATDKS